METFEGRRSAAAGGRRHGGSLIGRGGRADSGCRCEEEKSESAVWKEVVDEDASVATVTGMRSSVDFEYL